MDLEKKRIFLRKSEVKSTHFGSTKLFGSSLRRHLEKKRRFICMEKSGFLTLSIGKLLPIIVDGSSRKGKNEFGATEVNSTHHRSTRVFGSLSTIDLKIEEIDWRKKEKWTWLDLDTHCLCGFWEWLNDIESQIWLMIDVRHMQQRQIAQVHKTEFLQKETTSRSEDWMKWDCNPISYLAEFRKYEFVESHKLLQTIPT